MVGERNGVFVHSSFDLTHFLVQRDGKMLDGVKEDAYSTEDVYNARKNSEIFIQGTMIDIFSFI